MRLGWGKAYRGCVPKLWGETIQAHRADVRAAVLEAAWRLAVERGVLSVTMAQVAAEAGIGRATLYKYFSSVEQILAAHHERHVSAHLAELQALAETGQDPGAALQAVLKHYARIRHMRARHAAPDLGALIHTGQAARDAEAQVTAIVAGCIRAAQKQGQARTDLAAVELAAYCLHALGAAGSLPSMAAVVRLVALVQATVTTQPAG